MDAETSRSESPLRLVDFLREEREAILQAWEQADREQASAQHLSSRELRNGIPRMLDRIADTAERAAGGLERGTPAGDHPRAHAEHRLRLKFSLEEVVREYALLRDVILDKLAPRVGELDAGELAMLNQALDECVLGAVVAYSDGAIQALEDQRLQVTLRSITDGVISTDAAGRLHYLNPAAEHLTGWSSQEAVGRSLDEVIGSLEAESKRPLPDIRQRVFRHGESYALAPETVLRDRNGRRLAIEGNVAPLRDVSGRVLGAVLVFRDVSASRAQAEELKYLATHDSLTGLPNRALLVDRISQGIAQAERNEGRLALLYLDLDRFKHINDTLGHPVGDALLKEVARRLQRCGRRTDTVSRLGGDEFAVLLQGFNPQDQVADRADQIVRSLAAPYRIASHEIHTSTSVGISIFPEDGGTPEALAKHADIAMYHAKECGRNTFRFFIPEMNRRAAERLRLEQDLRQALEDSQLELHFQPLVALASGRVVGAEALLRWRHPVHGQLSPSRFVPVAEDSALIVPIGDWVLEQACRQAQRWREAGLPNIRMAVNVSAVQFRHASLFERVAEVLERTGLPAGCLELELTESAVMSTLARTAGDLRRLKDLGVRLAIDDFGTGYSSLSYLKQLPVDDLKIDQSFVRDIATDPNDAAIVRAIISMGHSLELGVVAEGAESQLAVDFLAANGCDRAQGYFFSRPLDERGFAQLLARQAPSVSAQH